MSATDFFDTNILVYAISGDSAKADRAERILSSGGVVSVQVLNEFAAVTRRKFRLEVTEIRALLAPFRAICTVVPVDVWTHDLGLELAARHQLPIYDGMIVASALQSECETLWSEDMNAGFTVAGLTVRNPFRDGI